MNAMTTHDSKPKVAAARTQSVQSAIHTEVVTRLRQGLKPGIKLLMVDNYD